MNSEPEAAFNHHFSDRLIDWYFRNKRDLPWRDTKDAYVIWLSEIILQQTRVKQGLPYFYKFLNDYPDVHSFAEASEQEVLKLWQGLGYYSRARNMLICARQVVEDYQGKFPSDYQELLKLKGVGKYTAAAIASIAFNLPEPVIDGNVFRVLSRIFGIENDISDAKSYDVFKAKASTLISVKTPDLFNQALMEFGALSCTPKSPSCPDCPFKGYCFAYRHNSQLALPVKNKKLKKRTRYFNYCVFQHGTYFLVKRRPKGDVWQGLYEFYLKETSGQVEPGNTPPELISLKSAEIKSSSVNFKHVLTHQTIFAQFSSVMIENVEEFECLKDSLKLESATWEELLNLPVSRLTDKYLKEEIEYLT